MKLACQPGAHHYEQHVPPSARRKPWSHNSASAKECLRMLSFSSVSDWEQVIDSSGNPTELGMVNSGKYTRQRMLEFRVLYTSWGPSDGHCVFCYDTIQCYEIVAYISRLTGGRGLCRDAQASNDKDRYLHSNGTNIFSNSSWWIIWGALLTTTSQLLRQSFLHTAYVCLCLCMRTQRPCATKIKSRYTCYLTSRH